MENTNAIYMRDIPHVIPRFDIGASFPDRLQKRPEDSILRAKLLYFLSKDLELGEFHSLWMVFVILRNWIGFDAHRLSIFALEI